MDREWTDKRVDDLAQGVDRRFDQVDERFDRFERSVDQRFDKVDARFDRFEGEVKDRFDKVDERFDRVEVEVKTGFATAATESKEASTQLNRTIWVGLIVIAVSRFLFG
jgi:predicted nuclease with TOPRIM domain